MEITQSIQLSVEQIRAMLSTQGVDIGPGAKLTIRQSKDSGQRLEISWPTPSTKAPKK